MPTRQTGDGAGILLRMPDRFVRAVVGDALPPAGQYGVGVCFLPQDDARRAELERLLEETVEAEGQRVIAWRDIPVDDRHVGTSANAYAPRMRQLVVGASPELATDQDAFERKLYVIRRVAELAAGPDLALPSFSSRTLVYKGMLTAPQLPGYFPDLRDERMEAALVLVHSRYSTNTFPSWELAHPYRMIAHNGEINTLRGNVNWMRARESQLASELFGDDLAKVLPVVRPGGSDTANFDNVLELLVLAGRSIPHAMMMMIPEAYGGRDDLPPELKGFYAYHQCLMEAWDGPAAIAFTDGRVIGATLDRNGLRPGRWLETKDGWVVLASETGVLDEPAENILRKGRLQPGKLFLVDLDRGRIVEDEEIKHEVATRKPYAEWYEQEVIRSSDLPEREPKERPTESLRARLLAFGYTQEDMKVILAPLARNAEEAVGSMGNDSPLAVLSDRKPAPLLVLQAALRPGDEPAGRLDPRGGRDERAGERRLRAEPARRDARARPPARDREPDPARLGARAPPAGRLGDLQVAHGRHHLGRVRRAGRDGAGARARVPRGRRRARRRRQHPDSLGPHGRARTGRHSVGARRRRRSSPPRSRGHAPPGRPDRRVGRGAQRAQRRRPRRLWRRGGQPVPDARDARRPRRRGASWR